MSDSPHEYSYGGVKYELVREYYDPDRPDRYDENIHYFDFFFCKKCLDCRYRKLDGKTHPHSIEAGATPRRIGRKE